MYVISAQSLVSWKNNPLSAIFRYTNRLLFPVYCLILSEAFIRKRWYSVLPVLDMTGRCRVRKAVVDVTELIAALVPIDGMMAFFADMDILFDTPS